MQDDADAEVAEPADDGAGGAAGDADLPDAPVAKRRFLPSSIGLTVLLSPDVHEIEARVTWGDYRTEPPLPEAILLPDDSEATDEGGKGKKKERPQVDGVRIPKEQTVRLKIADGRGPQVVVRESAAPQRSGGGLVLESHSRKFAFATPTGQEEVRALIRDRPTPSNRAGTAWSRCRRHHALHAAPADARPVRPRGRGDLRARTDAQRCEICR